DLIDSDVDWCADVFSWLWDNDQTELENNDDQGAYPSEDSCKIALYALGYLDPEIKKEDEEELTQKLIEATKNRGNNG
ncbi:MAG: hypothetical protein DRP42_02875, partial [Tenericutes bacterium]